MGERELIASFWSLGAIESDGKSPVAIASQLGVFSRPRSRADRLPPSAIEAFETMLRRDSDVPVRSQAGQLLADESRLALNATGDEPLALYLVPTTRGWVCYWASTTLASRCVADWDGVISIGINRNREAGAVHGLVADEIISVEISVGGQKRSAYTGENSFYLKIDGLRRSEVVDSLVAFRRSGSPIALPLETGP